MRAMLGVAATLLTISICCAPAEAEGSSTIGELKQLNVEDLMNVEVTSVSRHPEKLLAAASAIQVITQEDIRRSGATSIPEALRLADNLQVAQKNSHDWAISARGFNTELANKLLVMIDGRTVYTPLFSGVFWDVQDYLLEDIDRIEVISGPGGALWGANAISLPRAPQTRRDFTRRPEAARSRRVLPACATAERWLRALNSASTGSTSIEATKSWPVAIPNRTPGGKAGGDFASTRSFQRRTD
jgi:outer membrane receptor protein involved in Fe transport